MKTITKATIIGAMKSLGLKKGDHLLVHSSLSSMGKVSGGGDTIIEALLAVIGKEGTLMMPTFGNGSEIFDPKKSNTHLGILPQTLWQRNDACRSRHPLASVAAIGPKAQWLINDHEKAKTAHGEHTPYARLAEIGGKILLLGVDQDRNTFLHTVEALAKLPFLKKKHAKYLDVNGRVKNGRWSHFPGPHRNFIGLQQWLESNGLVQKEKIGSSVAQLMSMQPLMDALLKRLKTEPNLFLSDNPHLDDGIWQKADLLRSQQKKESFTLAVDSQYAGRYIDEIINYCHQFAIDHIVLSFVDRVAWNQIDQTKRKWLLQGLRLANIKVQAIKLALLNHEKATELLGEAKTDSLVIPSTCPFEDIVRIAKKGFKVYIENVGIDGTAAAELMTKLQKKNPTIQLAYNPLSFTQVGENPFLGTYQTRANRYMGMLFINDGLTTGKRTPLEQGQCEIKELISILRCKSYDGLFVLQAMPKRCSYCDSKKFFDLLRELGQ
jgi:aminoglycoside 3-N-acetyltransferase